MVANIDGVYCVRWRLELKSDILRSIEEKMMNFEEIKRVLKGKKSCETTRSSTCADKTH